MNFKDNFFTDNILKFGGEITLEIFSLSINSLIEKYLPYFMIALNFQEIYIDMKLACLLMTISTYPKVCRRYSITASTIYSWNSMQDLLIKHLSLKNATPKRIKYVLSKIFNCKPTQVFNRISTNFNWFEKNRNLSQNLLMCVNNIRVLKKSSKC